MSRRACSTASFGSTPAFPSSSESSGARVPRSNSSPPEPRSSAEPARRAQADARGRRQLPDRLRHVHVPHRPRSQLPRALPRHRWRRGRRVRRALPPVQYPRMPQGSNPGPTGWSPLRTGLLLTRPGLALDSSTIGRAYSRGPAGRATTCSPRSSTRQRSRRSPRALRRRAEGVRRRSRLGATTARCATGA